MKKIKNKKNVLKLSLNFIKFRILKFGGKIVFAMLKSIKNNVKMLLYFDMFQSYIFVSLKRKNLFF